MTEQAQSILDLLKDRDISFQVVEHNPVYTIDEMLQLNLPNPEAIAKNLFVRDDKKRNYYLIVAREEKRVELKSLRKKIDARPLTFASETDLNEILSLSRGAVSPFGILNDKEKKVKVILDQSFQDSLMGIHPNDNTATVWVHTADLAALLTEHGNSVEFVEI